MTGANITPQPWMLDALCRQVAPDLFYPEEGEWSGDAKRICQRCPVTVACLTYALENGETEGIWGGMTARARRPLHKQVRRAA